MRSWTLVKAIVDELPADWAPLVEAFREAGVEGTVEFESPPSLGGYAFESNQVEALSATLLAAGASRIECEEIEEVNWAESWKQFFKPRRIGSRIVVRPTWEPFTCNEQDIEIVIDPGQSFGTGDHPTTRMCLELIESLPLKDARVADIGCGSGILTIALAKLGASSIYAVDSEAIAVEATLANLARNGCNAQVVHGRGFHDLQSGAAFDMIASNLISAALIALCPMAAQRLKQGGAWIVSGIIYDNWDDVQFAVSRAGFSVETQMREDGWVAAILRI